LVGAFKADPVGDIGKALDLPNLGSDPRFATHELRVANKPALHAIFRAAFKSNTTAHWLARLGAQDLLGAPVRTLGEARADEQTRITGMILEGPGAVETVRVMGSPAPLSEAPVTTRRAPPQLGQHTDEVLAEYGPARARAVPAG